MLHQKIGLYAVLFSISFRGKLQVQEPKVFFAVLDLHDTGPFRFSVEKILLFSLPQKSDILGKKTCCL